MSTATDVARLVLRELGGETDAFRLQKIVYYCQAWHVTQTKRRLFGGVIQAWRNGPVSPDLWPQHRGRYLVNERLLGAPSADPELDDDSIEIIRAVVAYYRQFPSETLVEMTHEEEPWRSVYSPGMNNVITTRSMWKFFSKKLAENEPGPDLPPALVKYVTSEEYARLEADAESESVNVALLSALLKTREPK